VASDAEAEDWKSKVDDGGTGGNAEAMTQKGHDGSAPGSRGGADMIFGILVYIVHKSKGQGKKKLDRDIRQAVQRTQGVLVVKLSLNRSAIRNGNKSVIDDDLSRYQWRGCMSTEYYVFLQIFNPILVRSLHRQS
jgi:hypothetical protein